MIHPQRVVFSLALCLLLAGFAGAQVALPAMPQGIKSATTIDADGKAKIQAYVSAQFKRLLSPDPAGDPQKTVREARDALSVDAKAGSQPASAEYQAVYTDAVTAEAKAALAGTKDIRVRLNVAIVIARVAENAPQTRLEPAVMLLVADGEPYATQVWGLRAARYIMPELAKIGAHKPLSARVLAIIKADPSSPYAEEAYEIFKPTEQPKVLAAVVDSLLTVAEIRTSKLQSGLPEDPSADFKAFTPLAAIATWSALTPEQRERTMQVMCNVLAWASYRADEQKGATRDQLGVLINKSASALFVMASITASTPKNAAAAGNLASIAQSIATASGGVNTANINYVKLTQPALPAIKAVPDFSNVKDPAPATPMAAGGE